ncbi:MAG: class I SAM-dependent methyltransferase, partial [Candidatus Paceibacterota bacterium]
MKKNSVREFEDRRWKEGDQTLVFRHIEASQMVLKGQKVLDIGCGDGLFMQALAQKGATVSGVDISEEGAKKCQKKSLNVLVADITAEDLPYQDKTFDAVIMLDVLEHVYDPDGLLREAIRVSKQTIIISVPNFNSLPARFQVLLGKVPENNRPNKGHVYWFNYPVLTELLRRNHLKAEKISCNTFFENKPIVGNIMKYLCRIFPSVFALSFVVKA